MSENTPETQDFDLGAEMRAIAGDVLTIVPQASDTKPLSTVEAPISGGVKIVLANRKNDYKDQSDFIVSQIISIPGQPLQRETYRWSSAFPDSKNLQFYETVGPDEKTGKTVSKSRSGFDQMDTEKLRELIVTVGKSEGRDG